MNMSWLLAVVLLSAELSAEPTFDVQARVVFGAEERELPATEVEPWIAKAIREAGFAKASPGSNWVTLAPTWQRLFMTERGGTIIDGKITLADGRVEVEIHGCEGTPLVGRALLEAGQRRVIRLTDGDEPRDYFVALRAVARNAAPPLDPRQPAETAPPAGPGALTPQGAAALVGIRAEPANAVAKFQLEQGATIVSIVSETGIGRTTLIRTGDTWPQRMRVRLRLRGLESLRMTVGDAAVGDAAAGGEADGDTTVEWSVASTRPHDMRTTLFRGKQETPLGKDDPLYAELRIVSDDVKIPLASGYFEVTVPAKLLAANPRELQLRWIDFYRN